MYSYISNEFKELAVTSKHVMDCMEEQKGFIWWASSGVTVLDAFTIFS